MISLRLGRGSPLSRRALEIVEESRRVPSSRGGISSRFLEGSGGFSTTLSTVSRSSREVSTDLEDFSWSLESFLQRPPGLEGGVGEVLEGRSELEGNIRLSAVR